MPLTTSLPKDPKSPLPEKEERAQPWRIIPGMPSKDEDEKYENGTKGIVIEGDEIRLDGLADAGTNLGG